MGIGAILIVIALILAIVGLVKSGGSLPYACLAVSAILICLDLLLGGVIHL